MRSKLEIAVYFDLICPWCLIGKRNLETALGLLAESDPGLSVAVDWRSAQLLPDTPVEGVDFAEFYERRLGGRVAVGVRQGQVLEAAKAAGCTIAFEKIRRFPNTARAHRLLQLARTSAGPDGFAALLDRLFAAYFADGLDIGDPEVLTLLAAETGLDPQAARSALDDAAGDGRWRWQAPGVPTFVFDDGAAVSGAYPPATLRDLIRRAAARPASRILAG